MEFNSSAEKILHKHGLKKTNSRLLVLDVFLSAKRALALEDLELKVFLKQHRVTIYRILKDFSKAGVLSTFYDAWGNIRYELNTKNKYHKKNSMRGHFSCRNCQKVFCFKSIDNSYIDLPKGFHTLKADILLEGLCEKCQLHLKLDKAVQSMAQ